MSDQILLPVQVRNLAAGPERDRPYLQEVDGVELSYAQTHEAVRRWVAFLQRTGVAEGSPVAVMLPTSAQAVVVWLALTWLGAIEVPINTELKGSLLSYVLENSTTRLLVTDHRYSRELAAVLSDAHNIESVVTSAGEGNEAETTGALSGWIIDGPGPDEVASEEHLREPAKRDLATILYTSGTTGPSKGVMIPWGQLHASTHASFDLSTLSSSDACYCPFALYHVTGKCLVYAAAAVGGRVVLRERWDTAAFWSDIDHYDCTLTVLMGSMANFLYRSTPADVSSTSLRHVLVAPLIPEIDEFRERFGLNVFTVFNMSEVSVPLRSGPSGLANASSCGRPRPGYECRIVDGDDEEVPVGTVGELVVRSSEPWTMMAGYWQKPEATLASWRNLWFHTGDAMRQDSDGNFYFTDRLKDTIRRRGENISSTELEEEVMRHPLVLEAAAVGTASEWGEEDVRITAVLRPGAVLDAGELATDLDERLPRFMRPRYIEIVPELPKTPTGKIQKVVIRQSPLSAGAWIRENRPLPSAR